MTESPLDRLARHFPRLSTSEMDGSYYWKSLDEHKPGDVIVHDGTEYRVLYSWPWWNPLGVQVYMAELIPVGVSIAGPATTATTPTGDTLPPHPYQSDVEGYCVECGNERHHQSHRRNFTIVTNSSQQEES